MGVILHDNLLAAITARQERARAALSGPYDQLSVSWPRTAGKNALIEFIAAEDPAAVLRHCARDLKVLQRHAPAVDLPELCCWCYTDTTDDYVPWPCPEIRDLAEAYGLEAL